MNHEQEKCPIIPSTLIRLNIGDDDFLVVAASHDSIQVFTDPKYNHLRYYDSDEQDIRMVWLPHEILADLYDAGIPHTKRESITEPEYEGYLRFLGQTGMMEEVAVEPSALEARDPIEAEVQKAHDHLDSEIEYYMKEWEV